MRWICRTATQLAAAMALAAPAAAQTEREPLAVYAAGSLRAALTDLSRAFESQAQVTVKLTLGASGLLKDRIEAGEPAQVFASANMTHPESLLRSGRAEAVQPFARNALCVLGSPAFTLRNKALAARLLDGDVRVGISTPRADPSGDYAFQMFERIESTGQGPSGSASALKTKALQLTGGPQSPPPPAGRSVYGMLVAEAQVDAFVTYCTNAAQARRETPALQVLDVPESINVWATYGIATLRPAGAAAQAFVSFVLGATGQAILRQHGFSAP